MQLTACPDQATWDRLLDGQCSADESQALELHLEICESCKAELSDTFTGLQLDTQSGPVLPPPERVKTLASQLKSLWGTVPEQSRRVDELDDPSVRFAPLLPGETGLGRLGHCIVKRLLGQGGMGCVLLARDTRLERDVAIKIMNSLSEDNLKHKSRFLREARAMAAIHNDHVVQIHHVDEDRGTPYFVMPLLHGETLQARLAREKTLPYADVLRIGREIALGLAAAHDGERKLIHRDVKPANIWLEASNNRVKLLDFGLALDPNDELSLTNPDALMGTAPYMSPEQARCETEVNERTDLFSLGAVLYEMTTGRMAFNRRGLMNTLSAVIGEQPVPAEQLVLDLPDEFTQLLTRLLAKNPADRPTSAAAVATELQALQRASQRSSETKTIVTEVKTSRPQTQSPRKLPKPSQSTIAGAARLAAVYVAVTVVDLLQHRLSTIRAKLIAASGGLLSLAFLAVIVINTGKGQLEIVTDESIQVTILEDKNVLLQDAKTNTTLRLRPGKHDFEVLLKDAAGEELGRFTTNDYKIIRSGKPVLNIRQMAAEAGIDIPPKRVQEGQPTTPGRDRDAAEWLLAQPGVFLQGHVDGRGIQLRSGQNVPGEGVFSIQDINLPAALASADELVHLEKLQHLSAISVLGTELDDSGLLKLCQRLSRCPSMHLLSLNKSAITDQGLAHLALVPALTSIQLSETRVTDEGMRRLAELKNLTFIGVSATDITDDGLAHLAGLKQVSSLEIGGTRITSRGLELLDSLEKLEKLSVGVLEITDADVIRLIDKHPRLDRLDLGSTQVTDAIIPAVHSLKNLNDLGINVTSISGNGYDSLKRAFPNAGIGWRELNDTIANVILSNGGEVTLRVVGTEQDQIITKPDSLPKELFRLRRLHIGAEEPKPDRFAYEFGGAIGALFGGYPSTVAAYQDLTVLEFSGRWFTDANMQQLRRNEQPAVVRAWSWRPDAPPPMSWLRELSLTNTAITDDGLAPLGYFKKLHKLDLSGTNLRGSGLKHLKELSELRELHLACPMLTEVFLPSLADLPKLEVLSLANSGIADGAVATLKQLTQLKRLDLTGTKLSPQAIEQLKAALPECQVIATP